MHSRNRPEARGQDRLGHMASRRFNLFLSDRKEVCLRFRVWKSDSGVRLGGKGWNSSIQGLEVTRLGGMVLNLRLEASFLPITPFTTGRDASGSRAPFTMLSF